MNDEHSINMEFYRIAIEARDLELRLFWQRSLFFAGFIAATFIGYYTVITAQSSAPKFLVPALLVLGVLFSLVWSLANRGSKYWYESWEFKVDYCEKLLGAHFFSSWVRPKKKYWLYQSRLYSVSKLAIYISDLVFFAWLLLLINHFGQEWLNSFLAYQVPLALVAIVVLVYQLLFKTRTDVPTGTSAELSTGCSKTTSPSAEPQR